MFEKILGKKKSIQRHLVVEFIIIIVLIEIFSIVGFYIFVKCEVTKIIDINSGSNEELIHLLTVIKRGVAIVIVSTAVISIAIIRIASKDILNPLENMVEATKKVASGNFDVRLETKRKDETEELVTNFNHMVKELGETELLQKDFIDNVSHEIKTPINSIQGFTKLLYDDNLKREDRKEYVTIIMEESNRLLNLSNNILKLAKLQHQDKITKKEKINIAEQIRKTLVLLEPKWREKNLSLSVNLNNVYFDGDEDLLFQVWTNLIDNAIKFSNQDGSIEIQTQEGNNNIIVKIKDNGIGMDDADLKKIFSRFYQVDKSHFGEGSGLGLSIVKRIIELSNGEIKVESHKNKGTTIIIELPIEKNVDKINKQ